MRLVLLLLAAPLLAQTSFTPVTPCRVADTRNPTGPFGGPMLTGGTARVFAIPSSPCMGNVTGASAYALNVTVVPQGPLGYLTVWPTGPAPMPVVSTLNSLSGAIVANAATVQAGINGAISVFSPTPTHLILDINGYYVPLPTPAPSVALVSAISYTVSADQTSISLTWYNAQGTPFTASLSAISGTGLIYVYAEAGNANLLAGFYQTATATLANLKNDGAQIQIPWQAQPVLTIGVWGGSLYVTPWVVVK